MRDISFEDKHNHYLASSKINSTLIVSFSMMLRELWFVDLNSNLDGEFYLIKYK